MYRSTDPIEPDGVARRREPPAGNGPAWLTDRPEPRSAYLFGDELEQSATDRADAPTEVLPTGTWQPATDAAPEKPGRHRRRGRSAHPLVVGGAAAAATLAVSLGVAALLLPPEDRPTEPIAADDAVAAAPAAPDTTDAAPGGALAPASPTSTPSALPSVALPSPTRTVTSLPSRTTAPSRQLQRTAAPSSSKNTQVTSATGLSAELQQVVDLVNQERAKAGCQALTVSDKLTLAAQRHSQDQADHKNMTHDGSDGSDVGERLDRVGYAWRAYGENVAWNQQSPAAVMAAWMNSSGHRANILNCSFTQIGVGVARSNGPYWTQDFGTPR
ncbi:CAP domain-containing protein [Micromonospora sp. NPDC006766]|uniref:CAP domain-containing protein n=1 Tax=Micromonospora sp. NPDC006766 TaxID=3154778 RepID=UPI0033F52E5F